MAISAGAKLRPHLASTLGSGSGKADGSWPGRGGAVGYPAGFVPVGCVVVVSLVVVVVVVVVKVTVDPFSSVIGSVVVVHHGVVVVRGISPSPLTE